VFPLLALAAACAGLEVRGDGRGEDGRGRAGPVLRTGESVLAVGFSNAASEADAYIAMGGDMLNGARGGCDTREWANGRGKCWGNLRELNADPTVIWLKIAHKAPTTPEALAADCVTVIESLKDEFPRLETVYVSGRTYGGYGPPGDLRGEPYARQTWDAVAICIERSPLAEPGPWLWYDDWPREYFRRDGIHPSDAGAKAVARILAEFFGG
jgi:hypothetical protein